MKIDREKTLITAGGIAAAVLFAPIANADGSASLNAAVEQVYTKRQAQCTPNMTPHFQGIQLTKVGEGEGSGRIIDANPSLGGPFDYMKLPNGSPGTPGWQYQRVDANDGSGIYWILLNFC
jgi:hypothetical protein